MTKSYKTLIKEIKELKMKIYTMFMNRKPLNIVNISVLPNFIYRYNGILLKIPPNYIVNID